MYPSFSPDGRWITYASNESGAWEVYVRRFPDNGTKVRVSSSGKAVFHDGRAMVANCCIEPRHSESWS